MKAKPRLILIPALGLSLVLVLGLGLALAFQRRGAPPKASSYGQSTLVVVGDAHFAPFTFLQDGKPAGFDVDLLKALAEREGLKVEIRLMDWTSATTAIKSGAADILLGVSELEERRSWLSFSERMLTMKSMLFSAKDHYAYSRVEDLGPSEPLGVEKGDIIDQYLRSRHPSLKIRDYPSMDAAITAIAEGSLDYAALDYYSGLLSIQRLKLGGTIKIIGDPIFEAAYCLGVAKGKEGLLGPLNEGLELLKTDGTIGSLQARWLGTGVLDDSKRLRTFFYVLAGFAALALALLCWNFLLRRAVHQRTADLQGSLEEKETLVREIHHRTKNTLQVIRSLVILEGAEFPDNEELQGLVKKTEDRIQSIALVHQMLYRSQTLSRLSIKSYLEELVKLLLAGFGSKTEQVAVETEIAEARLLLDLAVPLGLIVNELLTNSLTHGFTGDRKGRITLRLEHLDAESYRLSYSDDGIGVPEGFDFRGQSSLGLKLIHSVGEDQLLGTLAMGGGPGAGVSFELRFKDNVYSERV